MEAVVFDGKEYIKASVLATRFRYTADYLGQLCRGKKVDARLVGRAWYINLDSLNQHRTGRYKTVAAKEKAVAEITPQKPVSNYLSRIDVEPILRKKTVSLVKATKGTLTELPVKYERDDYSLIPHFNAQAVSRDIRIDQADAEQIKIHKEKTHTTAFKAEALPEVYLKGAIKVSGLAEAAAEFIDQEPESNDNLGPEIKLRRMPEPVQPKQVMIRQIKKPVVIPLPQPVKPTSITPVNQVKITEIVAKTAPPSNRIEQKPLIRPRVLVKRPQPTVAAPVVAPKTTPSPVRIDVVRVPALQPNFKPQAVVHGEARKVEKQESATDWSFVFFAVVAATSLSVWILGVRAEISVDGGRHTEHWKFDIEQLRERF